MASALDILCGQAFGAKQYRKLGIQTGTAILCLGLVCIPLSLILLYMGKILVLVGQDPIISQEAGKFGTWLIPALFGYGTLQPLTKYFQTQSLIIPLLVSSCTCFCCHVPLCWALVFKSGLGHLGAALAIGISYWLNVILLVLHMTYSPACESTRVRISFDLIRGWREFLRFAIPSAVMIWYDFCLLIPNSLLYFNILDHVPFFHSITLALNGGHMRCLCYCRVFYQIPSSRLQCHLCGISSILITVYET